MIELKPPEPRGYVGSSPTPGTCTDLRLFPVIMEKQRSKKSRGLNCGLNRRQNLPWSSGLSLLTNACGRSTRFRLRASLSIRSSCRTTGGRSLVTRLLLDVIRHGGTAALLYSTAVLPAQASGCSFGVGFPASSGMELERAVRCLDSTPRPPQPWPGHTSGRWLGELRSSLAAQWLHICLHLVNVTVKHILRVLGLKLHPNRYVKLLQGVP